MTARDPNHESKDSRLSEARGNAFSLSVCSTVAGEELIPEIAAVERYFGGSSYSADSNTRERIHNAIHQGSRLVSPLMAFAIKPIQSVKPDGTLHLSGGLTLPVPDSVRHFNARFLAAAIGTLGKELETNCRHLATEHLLYESTLLDAVGTAMLDALDIKIRGMIDDECRLRYLFSGARFAPGINGYPMDHQRTLFQLADGESMDVRLNDAFLMEPVKTISFFMLLGCNKVEDELPDKCLRCSLPRCQFRKMPSSDPDAATDRGLTE